MATSIQISEQLQIELNKMKIFERETYEDIIWDLMEDRMELNDKTKKELALARKEKKTISLEQIKKEMGLS